MPKKDIKVPNIGEFKDVEVIEILIKKGQEIKKNDPLITIESDKSSVEIPSLHDGLVTELNLKVGDKVSEGSKILEIELKDNNVETKVIQSTKKENIKDIDWIDITHNSDAEKETSRNDKELLRRLHVKENGKIIQGAEAFLYVWKKIPKYKFLYKFFKLPIIFTIFKYGYEIIAFFLYLKNKKQLKKLS